MYYSTDQYESHTNEFHLELANINIKFFQNPLFCSKLKEYLWTDYNVQCEIPSELPIDDDIGITLKLTGTDTDIRLTHDHLQKLFQMVKTKIYDNEHTDKKVIYWSKNIYSDSAIDVLQKIFDNHNILTAWEKTAVLSGYYAVHYFSPEHKFHVEEKSIDQIINNEINYVRNMTISNFDAIQKNFREELLQFINQRKQEQQELKTLAIIYYEYPSQKEMQLSFFGKNTLVNNARKYLQYLLNKHTIRTINIGLNAAQIEHLLANCVPELENIESEYIDDNVKIQISKNLFHAPQYLITKIKTLINNLVFYTATVAFQSIGNACRLSVDQCQELNKLARSHNFEIENIHVETTNEIIQLPNAKKTFTISATSASIIEESSQFIATLKIPHRLSILTGGIEVHKVSDIILSTIDVSIISTLNNLANEAVEFDGGYVNSETTAGRNLLFIPWMTPFIEIDSIQADLILEKSIKEFISNCLTQVASLSITDTRTITFSLPHWESYSNKHQLAKKMISILKSELETEKYCNNNWTILFVFDDKQLDMYDLFVETILSMDTHTNDYKQFCYPISTIKINLKTTRNHHISKCKKVINDYFQQHIITKVYIDNAFDSAIWNQHMINICYKYCIEKLVLPKIDFINDKSEQKPLRLELTGPLSVVHEMVERYELMQNIIKLKISVPILGTEQIGLKPYQQNQWITADISLDAYNIVILSCPEDEVLVDRLHARLTDEGYSVYLHHSDAFFESLFKKTDVILVCFSRNYSENEICMAQIQMAKASEKKIIPVLLTENLMKQDRRWLNYIRTMELCYELFKEEIRFKLNGEFNIEYEKLLVELLRYTKPGVVGQTYSILSTDLNKNQILEETSDKGYLQQELTSEEMHQRKETYGKIIEHIKERDRISADQVKSLMESLTLVIEDYDNEHVIETKRTNSSDDGAYFALGQKKNAYSSDPCHSSAESKEADHETKHQSNISDLFLCFQRWMKKASNETVTKGNLPPFSPTGDFNDAIYPILLLNKAPWWENSKNCPDLDHSPPNIYFNNPPSLIGSWFNRNEALDFSQRLTNRDVLIRIEKQKRRQKKMKLERTGNSVESNEPYYHLKPRDFKIIHDSNFTTEFKKGEIAWSITKDALILRECEKRRRTIKKKTIKKLTTWDHLVERSIKLIADIKEGKIDLNSDILQGRIGNELKTEEEMRKLHELDNPKNKRWTKKQPRHCTKEFLQAKLQNIIELQKLCEM